ncbi:MAG: radical SAM protein [bacterium]|nr:radical SAM protein [bacterium]
MEENRSLEEYLSNGVRNIVKGILKASFTNRKTSIFMTKYMVSSRRAREKRKAAEAMGEHIPPFLIASITNKCNLHCKGCYARANHSCTDHCGSKEAEGILTGADWGRIFTQAEELGIEFILLAGGEPFVRKDVLLEAGKHSNILFPIFTNGTMINESFLKLLEKNRNLMPVISMEGEQETTDARRGEGIYQMVEDTMKRLNDSGVLFGASVTVTKQNMQEVFSDAFVHKMKSNGIKAIIYVEYVPVDQESTALALDELTRKEMMQRLDTLRREVAGLIFIAFPGDEKTSGGCLAAGRGFFHINARGGAEPCPFSPYSDTNVRTTSLKEALSSPLFCKLKENGNLTESHIGGCVLFEQEEQVKSIVEEQEL